jgi:beta-galactosidase
MYARNRMIMDHIANDPEMPLLYQVTDEDQDDLIVICGEGFRYSFDERTGMPVSMIFDGEELIDRPVEFNFWRAPVDNDMFISDLWKLERLEHTTIRAYGVSIKCDPDHIELHVRQSAGAVSVQPVMRMETVWTIGRGGSITLRVVAAKDPQILSLPRFGIRLFLKKMAEDGFLLWYGTDGVILR